MLIVTRFPPSPTGLLQAGNVRTALFNYLFARQSEGKFILRIEDTDRERSKEEFENNILETMQWLGLAHDAFYRQSDNIERHKKALAELIEKDIAYVSKEDSRATMEAPRGTKALRGAPSGASEGAPRSATAGKRTEVIRFRNPNEVVTFTDIIRGPISIDTTDLDDFVIAKSMDEPLYHFVVVVDDFDEGVTHVIRGDDHISNTPRQILILRALGGDLPVYAHLPLLLGSDRKKLSKRTGAKAITQYRDEGFIAEAVINYLALLGWHPEGEEEIFSLQELVEQFDLDRIQKGAAIFDEVKLRWFNHQHLKRLRMDDYANRLRLFMGGRGEAVPSYLEQIVGLLQERAETLRDAAELLKQGEFSFMEDSILADKELLIKGSKTDENTVKQNLEALQNLLEAISEGDWNVESVKKEAMILADASGKAQVLWPMRTALSGREKSPDPFTIAALIGMKKTLERIERAVEILK